MGCGTSRDAVQQPSAAELPAVAGEVQPLTEKKPAASLMEYVKLGVPMLAKAVDAVAPMLPFPGGEAAAVLSALLGMTERAIANHDNLKDLRQRAVAFLDILDSYHAVLLQIAKYHEVVGEYKEHLQGIVVYSKKYCSRNCVLKLLGGANDEAHFQQLCGGLQDLTKRTMLLLQTDTLGRVQNVEVLVGEALAYLRSTAKYQDASAEIEELVAEAGGSVRELVARPGLLREALGRLDIKDRLSIQMVTSLLAAQTEDGPHRHIRQPDLQVLWKDKFSWEPEVPWYTFFEVFPSGLLPGGAGDTDDDLDGSTDEVEDDSSQGVNGGSKGNRGKRPGHGSGASDLAPGDGGQRLKRTKSGDSGGGGGGGKGQQLAELRRLLRSPAARAAFQRALDRDTNGMVSVYELRLAFSGDQGLVEQVERVLQQTAASRADNSGGAAHRRRRRARAGGGRRRRRSYGSSERGGYADEYDSRSQDDGDDVSDGSTDDGDASADLLGRCMLPPPEPGHVGREAEAAEVAAALARGPEGSLILLGEGGLGKSSLAAAAGWKLYNSNVLSGAALWVDLREAHRGPEVEARFCAVLGIPREEEDDNVRRIAAALRRALGRETGGGGRGAAGRFRVLVVVDNAEDAAGQEDAAMVLRALLQALVGRGMEAARVVVTSRVPLGLDRWLPYKERRVGPISSSAAVQIVRAAAKDLTEEQAERVAAACGEVPLYLRLISEAIVAGRLRLEDIAPLARQPSSASSSASSSSSQGPSGGRPQSQTSRSSIHSGAQDGASPRGSFSVGHTRGGGTRGGGGGGAGGSSAAAVDPLVLVLRSLKPPHRAALHQLAVFPSAFDDEAAAAVLQTSPEQAHALLVVLYGNSLLQRGGNGGTDHIVHKAVRQALLAGGADSEAAAQRADAEARYGLYVLRLLGQWAKMYGSIEYGLALAMARDRQPDIGRVAELLAAAPGGGGATATATALQAAIKTNVESDPDLAAALSYKVLELRTAFLSDKHPDTGAAHNSLANTLEALGADRDDAQTHYGAAVRILTDTLGEEHPHTLATSANLARCLLGMKDLYECEERARAAMEAQERVLGPAHPDTLATTATLAACLQEKKKYAESERLYRKMLAAWRDGDGGGGQGGGGGEPGEPGGSVREEEVLRCKLDLAHCVGRDGRESEAESLFREVLEARQARLGPEHVDTLASQAALARCVLRQGRQAEAQALLGALVEVQRRVLGQAAPATLATEHWLASCMLAQGDLAVAEAGLRGVLRSRMRVYGTEHELTLDTMELLAKCLMMQERFAEAQPIFELARGMGGGQEDRRGGRRSGDGDDGRVGDHDGRGNGEGERRFVSVQAH